MRWMSRISPADLVTMTNGLLGTLAITYILDGEHMVASFLLFVAVAVDGIDGPIARKFGSPHDFGRFLDSISDGVSFCLAPGLLIYNNFYDKGLGSAWGSIPNALALIACMAFVTFGLLRLSRFAGKEFKYGHFIGLPTPAAAMIVIITCMLWGREELNPFAISYSLYYMTGFILFISLLMISDVPYPKFKRGGVVAAGAVLSIAGIPPAFEYYLGDVDFVPAVELELVSLLLLIIFMFGGPVYMHYLTKAQKN